MPRGRPLPPLEISMKERETLARWIARRKTAQALSQRARLVLCCTDGRSNQEVAAQVGLTSQTVCKHHMSVHPSFPALRGDRFQFRPAAAGVHHHIGALLGKGQGHRSADVAAGSRNQGCFST